MTTRSSQTTLRLPRALQEFLATEIAGGIALLSATVVALAWANSPWRASYRSLWATDVAVRVGGRALSLSLHDWVNEGLMGLFFLVVGLELKRELVHGELRDRRQAALPAVAALGGMVVPALVYLLVNRGGVDARGWGVPMATDIAFALGVLALVGRRVPPSLRLFLLTLAIVDDVGSVIVIAVFYAGAPNWVALSAAGAVFAVIVALRQIGVRWTPVFVAAGVVAWFALHQAGVAAGLVGFPLGLLAPATAAGGRHVVRRRNLRTDPPTTAEARRTVRIVRESVPVVEWLEHVLHPWVSFGVAPLFALANAGVPVGAAVLSHAAHSPVGLGVVVARVVGKPVGITAAAYLAVRLGLGRLPSATRWRDIAGVGVLASIGFTVALFVTDIGLQTPALRDDARIGILAAAVLGGGAGAVSLLVAGRSRR